MKNHTSYFMVVDNKNGLPALNKALQACVNHNKLMHKLPDFNGTGQVRYSANLKIGKTNIVHDDNGLITGYATRVSLTFINAHDDVLEKEVPNSVDEKIQERNHINGY